MSKMTNYLVCSGLSKYAEASNKYIYIYSASCNIPWYTYIYMLRSRICTLEGLAYAHLMN